MHIVLSLGGSLVNTEHGIDTGYLERIRGIIARDENSFGIVVGGGYGARKKARRLRERGAGEFECDEAAIRITWKNAKAVIDTLGTAAHAKVIKDFYRARRLAKNNRIIVMGGTIPGITTDADSVLLAEAIGAKRLVNISNVDAIYDSDPNGNPAARKYAKLGYEELIGLVIKNDKRTAGTNFVFDLLACRLLARSKIEAHFVSGKNLHDVENAINGKPHGGTVVSV